MTSKAYEVVTDRVLELLDKGVVPWRRPWKVGFTDPRNLKSGRSYRGVNAFVLACQGYADPRWLTYRQAAEMGGQVRKGEHGTPVVFFSVLERDPAATRVAAGKKDTFAFARYSTAFNVAQVDGLVLEPTPEAPKVEPVAACEAVLASYEGPVVLRGHRQACYSPVFDEVRIPDFESFDSAEHAYATLFHELGHSTGHANRLGRKGIIDPIRFASHEYSEEELVAEMTACFLCAEAGIEASTIKNAAAYIDHWLAKLKGDRSLFVRAAGQAHKAADLILGRQAARREEEAA